MEEWDGTAALASPTGATLAVRRARARGRPRGLVLVAHGLAELSGRYGRFARELAEAGFHVVAGDHRGHGRTSAPDAAPRRFAARNGAAKVVADMGALAAEARGAHPGLPLVVFGHSMGALVAANLAQALPDLAGLALWNADLNPGADERLARLALGVERALKGSDVPSAILMRATFEAWGRSVAAARTPFDWLSHDAAAVERYLADPLCGFRPTISMMADVVALAMSGGSKAGLARLPAGLPVHLLGGSRDPATAGGRAVGRLAERLSALGRDRVELRIVSGARHETLNELPETRAQAMRSLLGWLDGLAPLRHA